MLVAGQVIVVITTVVVAIYWYCTRNFNYWKHRNVPYKTPSILFGSVISLLYGAECPTNFLARLYNEFKGPYFGFFAMNTPYLVIKDPDIIKRILVKDFNHFSDRLIYNDEKVDPIAGNFLFGLESAEWRILRKKISPVFTSGKIKMTFPLMTECADNMIKYLNTKTETPTDATDLTSRYTLDVIASCVFGIKVDSFADENNSFRQVAKRMFKPSFKRTIQHASFVFNHTLVKFFRFHFFDKISTEFLRKVFYETVAQRELSKNKRHDFIDGLIDIKNVETGENGYQFDNDKLFSQAVMFFAAGFISSSYTLSYTLYEMALNQDVQERLRKEIFESLEINGELTYKAIQEMKYLDMVVSETLRKYSVTGFLHRKCEKDYLIPETGLVIKRGCRIIVTQQGLHWNPEYFPEPEKFRPERFDDKNKVNINPYCYLPFGSGPRNCIGDRFGIQNVKIPLVRIIQEFKIETNPATRSKLVFSNSLLLIPAGGIPLTFNKISSSL